jgi:hypothetical protein
MPSPFGTVGRISCVAGCWVGFANNAVRVSKLHEVLEGTFLFHLSCVRARARVRTIQLHPVIYNSVFLRPHPELMSVPGGLAERHRGPLFTSQTIAG